MLAYLEAKNLVLFCSAHVLFYVLQTKICSRSVYGTHNMPEQIICVLSPLFHCSGPVSVFESGNASYGVFICMCKISWIWKIDQTSIPVS